MLGTAVVVGQLHDLPPDAVAAGGELRELQRKLDQQVDVRIGHTAHSFQEISLLASGALPGCPRATFTVTVRVAGPAEPRLCPQMLLHEEPFGAGSAQPGSLAEITALRTGHAIGALVWRGSNDIGSFGASGADDLAVDQIAVDAGPGEVAAKLGVGSILLLGIVEASRDERQDSQVLLQLLRLAVPVASQELHAGFGVLVAAGAAGEQADGDA